MRSQGERRNAGGTPANMRARHNMKTLSALSRKAHSNVLSLAATPATRSLTPGGGSAASGRQDFSWVLVSAGFPE